MKDHNGLTASRIYTNEHGDTVYLHTNYKFRELLAFADLTAKQRAEVDYMERYPDEEYSLRFVIYQGSVVDVNDGFTVWGDVAPDSIFAPVASNWDGIQTDSAFSALVIKYGESYESVRIGRIHW